MRPRSHCPSLPVLAWTLAFVGPLACASQAPELPQPAVVLAPEMPPTLPPDGESPAPACTVSEPALDSSVSLRLHPDGDVVAILREQPSASLALPAHRTSEPPRLVLENEGVVLFTPHDEEEAPLRLRNVLAFRKMVVPYPSRPITWQSVSGTDVTTSYELGPSFEPMTVQDVIPCDAIGFNEEPYEAADLYGRSCEPGDHYLVAGESVSMRSALDDTAEELTFQLSQDAIAYVDIWRTQEDWAHICFPTDEEFLVGWVKRSSLRSEPLGLIGKGYGIGRGVMGMRRRSGGAWTRCPHELPLYAQVGEERGEVGRVRKETPFEVVEARENFTVVDLWANWIVLKGQSTLMVPTEAMAACKTR